MTSSPRAVPFLPDGHPYFEGYHFPAMTRCDPDHRDSGWMNYQRSAAVREAHQGEAPIAPVLSRHLPAEIHLTLVGIPVAIAATLPTDSDLGFDREAD
jgi:hypothetical protein